MSRHDSTRLPSYRLHRASGWGVVALDRRDIYLGKHGTAESRLKTDKVKTDKVPGINVQPDRGQSGLNPARGEFETDLTGA